MYKILFINSNKERCGVYQYGLRTSEILQKCDKNKYIYLEPESFDSYNQSVILYNPDVIIYNNHSIIMPWLTKDAIDTIRFINNKIKHIGIYHEGDINSVINSFGYDYMFNQDPTFNDTDRIFSLYRPLYNKEFTKKNNTDIPVINSFGFSFNDKGFEKIVNIVCEQFDNAIINLHLSTAQFNRPIEENIKVIEDCKRSVQKSGITLNITTDFMDNNDLLAFLSDGDLNIFLYEKSIGRGISSVIDYALSVNNPIAISKSEMFRHIINASPSICVEDRSLSEIMRFGVEPLMGFKNKWSNLNFINRYNYLIDKILK